MATARGGRFWPLDPRVEHVELIDIAHALSQKCRYNGHCRRFYSVAEHSVLVSRFVPPELALWGLLHDATEAYIPDVIRPLKTQPEFAWFRDIEDRIAAVIAERFGLSWPEPAEVKLIDRRITADEIEVLMVDPWPVTGPKVGAVIECLDPTAAMTAFLKRFIELWKIA